MRLGMKQNSYMQGQITRKVQVRNNRFLGKLKRDQIARQLLLADGYVLPQGMKTAIGNFRRYFFSAAVFAAALWGFPAPILKAQVYMLTKLHDFAVASPGNPVGMNPYDIPIQIGNELWFTTENGGTTGFGTLSSFDLVTNTITTRLNTMDISTGNTPQSRFLQDGNNLYYTTSRGGTGDRGTLNVYNTSTNTNTVLHNSPSNTPSTNLYGYHSNVVRVGDNLYWMARNGGPLGVQGGAIMRYNLSTSTVTTAHVFNSVPGGRFPFHGLTAVGNMLYFTTFTGGQIGTGSPNGAGTLCSFDTTKTPSPPSHRCRWAVVTAFQPTTRSMIQ
jgi:uncharacterized repeat protein (TIGR03803 family)